MRRGGAPWHARVWRRADTEAVIRDAADELRAQLAAGEGPDGSPGRYASGPKAGQPVTLRQSGALLRSLKASAGTTNGAVTPTVPHAGPLARRYPGLFTLGRAAAARVRKAIDARVARLFEE